MISRGLLHSVSDNKNVVKSPTSIGNRLIANVRSLVKSPANVFFVCFVRISLTCFVFSLVPGEANKQVDDYKYKLRKAEQENMTLQSSVSVLSLSAYRST